MLGEHRRGVVVAAEGEEAAHGVGGATTSEVGPGGAQDRRGGALDVDPSRDHAASYDLAEQGVDEVAVLAPGCAGAGRHPADEQAGGLQGREHLSGARVPGQVPGGLLGEVGLARDAQQQVPLLRAQADEHLTRHEVGDAGRGRAEERGHVVAVLHRGAGPGGQHQRGTPAPGPRHHGVQHVGTGVAGVPEDQPGRLLPAEPEGVAAQDGQVTEELGHESGDGQVPPGQQQEPEAVGVGGEAVPDQAHAGRREQVCVVDDQQSRELRRGRCGSIEEGPQLGDGARGGGGVPARIREVARLREPPGDAEGLAGAGRSDDDRDGLLGRGVEPAPEPVSGRVVPGQPRGARHGSLARDPGPGAGRGLVAPTRRDRADIWRHFRCRHVRSLTSGPALRARHSLPGIGGHLVCDASVGPAHPEGCHPHRVRSGADQTSLPPNPVSDLGPSRPTVGGAGSPRRGAEEEAHGDQGDDPRGRRGERRAPQRLPRSWCPR